MFSSQKGINSNEEADNMHYDHVDTEAQEENGSESHLDKQKE